MDKKNIFEDLIKLYLTIDSKWYQIALQYGFLCKGCVDNCCQSLFFHHTFIEKAYLISGFKLLSSNKQKDIIKKAEEYCTKVFDSNSNFSQKTKIICPLNENGLCILYQYRPMICRLHGLPHELLKSDSKIIKFSGCKAGLFENKKYIKFDRTPFYKQMALIEMEFRKNENKVKRIKETIAHMLI